MMMYWQMDDLRLAIDPSSLNLSAFDLAKLENFDGELPDGIKPAAFVAAMILLNCEPAGSC